MKKILEINKLLQDKELSTKVQIFMGYKVAGDDYDEYENNYQDSTLNPIIIKAFVRRLLPEQAFWKQYGVHEDGLIELLTEDRWEEAFKNCSKVVIEDAEYQVYKTGTGSKATIIKRKYELLRVVLSRNG